MNSSMTPPLVGISILTIICADCNEYDESYAYYINLGCNGNKTLILGCFSFAYVTMTINIEGGRSMRLREGHIV